MRRYLATASAFASAEELKITIENFAFSPKVPKVKPGQKITVTNLDAATHTLTSKDGSIDSGDLAQGRSYTFEAPSSSKDYICTPHPQMEGTLEVS